MRARAEYVRRLVESLERRHLDLSGTAFAGVNEATLRALRTALHGEPATVLHALTLVQQHAQTVDFEPELRALLQHQDPRIRAAALDQLGEQKKSEALPEMRELLRDPTPEVRAAALGAVCAIEQEAAVQTVLPFLEVKNAPEAVVRAAAAVALIRHAGLDGVLAAAEPLKQLLGTREAADALLTVLTTREAAVRKAAARALARLTRRQRGLVIDRGKVERAVHSELGGARVALGTLKKLSLAVPIPGRAPKTPAGLLGAAPLEERAAPLPPARLLLEVALPGCIPTGVRGTRRPSATRRAADASRGRST